VGLALLEAEPADTGRFEVASVGVDDVTLGFDLQGSKSVPHLDRAAGAETRRGKMLGERSSWGSWANLLGRSVAFWKSDTSRLYVQAKLAEQGELCPLDAIAGRARGLTERMAAAGIVSYAEPWVTRMDVAIDARCRPNDGKLLLDALEFTRLPNGWRTRSVGVPRSTVYFSARTRDSIYARAYCRNLRLKSGEPFGLIRLESEHRFGPKECSLEIASDPSFAAELWMQRYGDLAAKVTRIAREVQTVQIHERMEAGELDYKQGERLMAFLDLERLGLATAFYPPTVYVARRREARKLGYASNETGATALDVDLDALLAPYKQALEPVLRHGSPSRGAAKLVA
jgi:hypothetical protein